MDDESPEPPRLQKREPGWTIPTTTGRTHPDAPTSDLRLDLEVAEGVYFREMGKLTGTLGWCHLAMKVNLTKMEENIDALCGAAKYALNMMDHLPGRTSAHARDVQAMMASTMRDHCLGTKQDFMQQKLIWVNSFSSLNGGSHHDAPLRPKRQLITGLLVGAAVAIGSAIYGVYELEQLAVSLKHDQAVNMILLQEHEARLTVDERSIKMLNQTITMSLVENFKVEKRVTSLEIFVQLHLSIQSQSTEYRRMIVGFRDLARHNLNPALIDMEELPIALKRLKNRLESINYQMDIHQVEDVFHLSTSHVYYDNGELIIFCHIPTYREGSKLSLYEFHALPMKLGSAVTKDNIYLNVVEPHKYLAVSDTEGQYQQLTAENWSSCREVLGNYYCPMHNIYHHQKGTSCLMGIYKKDVTTVRQNCKWDVTPANDQSLQIGPNSFLLFQKEDRLVKLSCPGKRKAEVRFSGLRRLTVPAGCRLLTDYFVMDGQVDVVFQGPTLDFHALNITEIFLPVMDGVSNATEMLSRLKVVGTTDGLTIEDITDRYETVSDTSLLAHGLGLSTICIGVAVVIIIAVLVICYFKRRNKKLHMTPRTYVTYNCAPASEAHEGHELGGTVSFEDVKEELKVDMKRQVWLEVGRIFSERDEKRESEMVRIQREHRERDGNSTLSSRGSRTSRPVSTGGPPAELTMGTPEQGRNVCR